MVARIATERVSEHSWIPPWVVREHQARYRFAAERIDGDIVVDCACGDGAGTQLYATRADHVYAFDVSDAAVADTRARGLSNVTAHVADGVALPIPDESADVVVSFETIEHIDEQARFVAELARVLKTGGDLILSTPNRAVYSPGHTLASSPWNPYHVRELDRAELEELLTPYFEALEWYAQGTTRPAVAQVLSAVGRAFPSHLAVRIRQLWKLRLFLRDPDARAEVAPANTRRPGESLVVVARKRSTSS